MDEHGIKLMMPGIHENEHAKRACTEHPDRFAGIVDVDPNTGMEACASSTRFVQRRGRGRRRTCWGTGLIPQVPINDKKMYPIYAKCVELDVPIMLYAGVPGPRILMGAQDVALLDEVCWYFPELKIVVRHGAEPWTELMVKLLLKWPNLYYSTSAFAPKHYPRGHHQLREHPRRRQDHLRGLLLRGPRARPDLLRAAQRPLPRPRLAEVPPRERGAGLRARGPAEVSGDE